MSLSRFRELIRKQTDRTISDAEALELEEILDDHAASHFETCPACKGAFSSRQISKTTNRCPNCDTPLQFFTTDLPGHDFHEIDDTIAPQQVMGVFSVGYAVPGTVPCLLCGTTYPHTYTCCPGLLVHAIQLIKSGTDGNRIAAAKFIDVHIAELLNSLRGGFASMFEKNDLEILKRIADELECRHELEAALKNAE